MNKYNDDKYYYNNDILLNDVVFYLYAKEDVYENGKLIYSKDDKVNAIIFFTIKHPSLFLIWF